MVNKALELVQTITTAPKNPVDRSKIPSLGSFIRKIKQKNMAAGRKNMFPMPYMVDEDPKTGKFKYKPKSMKKGGTNSSCPYRENGVRSPIKGIKPLQIKGVKFTGVK